MKTGRRSGYISPETTRMLPIVRQLRAQGKTYRYIGDVVGRTSGRVYQMCKRYDIPAPTRPRSGEGKLAAWRSLPAIDPARARAITERNRAYWTFRDPSLRRRSA